LRRANSTRAPGAKAQSAAITRSRAGAWMTSSAGPLSSWLSPEFINGSGLENAALAAATKSDQPPDF
jgi:hypothetical protein